MSSVNGIFLALTLVFGAGHALGKIYIATKLAAKSLNKHIEVIEFNEEGEHGGHLSLLTNGPIQTAIFGPYNSIQTQT